MADYDWSDGDSPKTDYMIWLDEHDFSYSRYHKTLGGLAGLKGRPTCSKCSVRVDSPKVHLDACAGRIVKSEGKHRSDNG